VATTIHVSIIAEGILEKKEVKICSKNWKIQLWGKKEEMFGSVFPWITRRQKAAENKTTRKNKRG